jgi:hypothetical protein
MIYKCGSSTGGAWLSYLARLIPLTCEVCYSNRWGKTHTHLLYKQWTKPWRISRHNWQRYKASFCQSQLCGQLLRQGRLDVYNLLKKVNLAIITRVATGRSICGEEQDPIHRRLQAIGAIS